MYKTQQTGRVSSAPMHRSVRWTPPRHEWTSGRAQACLHHVIHLRRPAVVTTNLLYSTAWGVNMLVPRHRPPTTLSLSLIAINDIQNFTYLHRSSSFRGHLVKLVPWSLLLQSTCSVLNNSRVGNDREMNRTAVLYTLVCVPQLEEERFM